MLDSLLPEGFKDEVSNQASIEHKYKNIIIDLFQINGFELVKPSLIEFTDQLNTKNSFKIKVDKKHRNLSIRDDITMQIARLSASRLSKKSRPLKLCYYGEVVRDKGSMLRPERQFLQIGAECIGESSFFADIEMIDLAYNALKSVGIENISIELSSRIFLDELYSKIPIEDIERLKYFIRKKDLNNAIKLIDTKKRKYLEDIFSCVGNFSDKQKNLEKLKITKKNITEINNLEKIYKFIYKKHPETNFFLDLAEFDDKHYHDGIRFTIFAKNVRGEIARGGRYTSKKNNTMEKATGFTCYMDTILRASSIIELTKKILVPFDIADERKKALIKDNFILETFFGDIKKIKEKAIEKKFKYCLIENKIEKIKD